MSKNSFSRAHSSRKSIKPVIDIDENEDDQRRDLFGRKRVDVIQCLLDSSSDENDDTNIIHQNSRHILWLTFAEICHIRSILAQTTLSTLMFTNNKQYSKIIRGNLCFRCRTEINSLSFIPSFFSSKNSLICYICQQRICKKCSVSNFLPPLLKHSFPVRIQMLIETSSVSIKREASNESNQQRKTICYDCSQIFSDHRKSSQCPIKPPITKLNQSLSSDLNPARHVQTSRSPAHISNSKIGNTVNTANLLITRF